MTIDRLLGRDVRLDGRLHPRFGLVAKVLERLLRRYEGGAAVCVYHHGECVVDLWGGVRDSKGRPWRSDTMAASFSTTKGVASTLVHIMVDRGLLDYDTRVVEYWPEFGQAGKEQITLRQVLSHQSGLYHIRQMIDDAERMLDWDHMLRAIERATPIHPPGERTGYHGLTYGFLVGGILQHVTGHSFQELVQKELTDLNGKRVVVGVAGAGFEFFVRPLLAAHGVTYDDFTPLYNTQAGSVDMLADGSASAAFLGGAVPTASITQAATSQQIHFVPYSEKAIEELLVILNHEVDQWAVGSGQ